MHGAARKFSEREAALIAVACAERRGDMVGGHFLEFGEMLFGRFGVAAALIGAGYAKFGGSMKRKYGESFLECRDRKIVVLKLRIQIADEIPRVGFVGNLRDVRERSDTFFRVTEIFVDEPEVVPSVRILRKFFSSSRKSGARRLKLLLSEQRDAEIESRDFEGRVGGERLLKKFLRIGGPLLIHVSDAKRVEAIRFGGVHVGRGFLRSCRRRSLCGAGMKKSSSSEE